MDWLFDNFFIVIIIVVGIYGFLKDKSAKQKQQQRKAQNRQKQTATPSGASRPGAHQQHNQRQQPQANARTTRSEQQQTAAMKTIEEQQKAQMEKFADKFQANTKQAKQEQPSHKAFIGGRARDPKQDQAHSKRQFKNQMKHNLNRKGLINSIVMAEVMGPPRAKKPYKNIIYERSK